MRRLLPLRRLGSVATLLTTLALAAPAQIGPYLWKNHPVNGAPYDLAITPDRKAAVLRTGDTGTGNSWIYVFDLGTGLQRGSPRLLPGEPSFGDALAVTHDRAIVIGDRVVNPMTGAREGYVEVLDILPASGPALVGTSLSIAGKPAVDVVLAIEPETADPIAVVRHTGLTGFWRLETGDNYESISDSGGDARELSDAVQVTPNRVAILAKAAVGIINLGNLASRAGHGFEVGRTGHDLAFTPDGSKVLTSGTGFLDGSNALRHPFSQILYFSDTPQTPVPIVSYLRQPYEEVTVDSVGTTNDVTVMIGHDGGTWASAAWRVSLLDIATSQLVTHVGPFQGSRAHDHEITPNQSLTVVTTRAGTLIFDLSTPSSAPTVVATSPDPLFWPSMPNDQEVFTSDSVATTDTLAVVIGTDPLSNQGKVQILSLPSGSVSATFSLGEDYIPTDVAITPDGTKAVVRAGTRLLDNTKGRITVYDLLTSPPTEILNVVQFIDINGIPSQFGKPFYADHVEVNNYFAISAGHDPTIPLPAARAGWFQIIKLKDYIGL